MASLVAEQQLLRLLDRLAVAGLPVIVLKGMALALTLYPDVALRPVGDIDLLIRHRDLPQARLLLLHSGYVPYPELAEGFQARFGSEETFLGHGTGPVPVDLHWHLVGRAYFRRHLPAAWFWQQIRTVTLGDRLVPLLAPTAQVLHLCLHLAAQHHGHRLLWTYDIACLLTRHGREIDWEEVIAAALAFHALHPLRVALGMVHQHWGVAPPEEAWQRLCQQRSPLGERVSLAVAGRRRSGPLLVLWDGLNLPDWASRLCYWWWHLFPGTAYMRHRYGPGPLWWAYLRRLGRTVLALVRSLAPEKLPGIGREHHPRLPHR